MIFELARGTKCSGLGTISPIVAPRKLDVHKVKLAYLPSKRSLSGKYLFKNIRFPWGNYQPIVPRQQQSIVLIELLSSYNLIVN